ncbi:MAG: flagellar motor switch protein FliG [Bacteriovoracales bacterium]
MAETSLDPDVQFALLSGPEKASILMSLLGTKSSQLIFQNLKDNDVKRLIGLMADTKQAPIWMGKKVMEEFYSRINEDANFLFADNKGKDFIMKTLGEERAKQLLGQTVDVGEVRKLESLELVDSRSLANFLLNEHPQTIALVIAHLNAEKGVEVLRRLPEALQAEVVLRIANLDYVSPDLITHLDELLKTELSTLGSMDTSHLGGVEPVSDMLNLMDKNTEKNIMSRVEEKDPELAEEIRKLMFVFEDLVFVDDQGIQNLLKEIDSKQLAISLKTAPDEVKVKIFSNMSTRASKLLEEDIAALGPTRLSEVEKTQALIVAKIKDLEGKGKAIITRGGEGGEAMV